MNTEQLFIAGNWRSPASGATYATINPATEETSAQVGRGDERDVDLAVAAARKAFDSGPWPRMSAAERGRIVWKLGDLIAQNLDEMARLESHQMKIAREEIFGPVLSVIPFKSVDDGIAEGNATTYGLAAAVWTRDVAKALKAARALRAGTVWVNAYNLFDAALPFGGFKESGFGREMGSAGLEHYTETKSVWVDLS